MQQLATVRWHEWQEASDIQQRSQDGSEAMRRVADAFVNGYLHHVFEWQW